MFHWTGASSKRHGSSMKRLTSGNCKERKNCGRPSCIHHMRSAESTAPQMLSMGLISAPLAGGVNSAWQVLLEVCAGIHRSSRVQMFLAIAGANVDFLMVDLLHAFQEALFCSTTCAIAGLQGLDELARVDVAAEAAKIPSDMHLYFLKAEKEVR